MQYLVSFLVLQSAEARPCLHMSKYHIVVNLMHWLNYCIFHINQILYVLCLISYMNKTLYPLCFISQINQTLYIICCISHLIPTMYILCCSSHLIKTLFMLSYGVFFTQNRPCFSSFDLPRIHQILCSNFLRAHCFADLITEWVHVCLMKNGGQNLFLFNKETVSNLQIE